MKPKTAKYLRDILEMAELIADATSGKMYAEYADDIRLRHQVQHELLIIGEAVAQLAKHDRATADRIREQHDIVGLRAILAHRYEHVDDAIIWQVIEVHLPRLVREVEALLAEHPDSTLEARND